MQLQRIETQHNTPDDVRKYLQLAEDIAKEFGIDREREHEVFVKLIDLLSSKTITTVQAQPSPALPNLGSLGLRQ